MPDGIPVSMCDVLESEPVAMAGSLQPRTTIDKKYRVVNLCISRSSERNIGEIALILLG
jgi:hypothetical protein